MCTLFDPPHLVDYDFNDTGVVDFRIHENQIVDWSLEQPDGTIRGEFATFALFEYFERTIGPLPKRTKALQDRFVDVEDL